ncbi:MAG TPA: universal stress protein [Gaiellaceae bacterium]|nr:universal stress protein [Gaiellaceae bacterium]
MAGTIVVGVDGSPASQAALRWAAEEARLRDARLVAVHAWTFVSPAPMAEPGMIPMPAMDFPGQVDAERTAAEEEFHAAVDEAFHDMTSSVEIERKLVEGDPAEVLEAEAGEADLVVVGSRGRSGIAAALLGSVSKHVVDRAACPAVVVKAPKEQ